MGTLMKQKFKTKTGVSLSVVSNDISRKQNNFVKMTDIKLVRNCQKSERDLSLPQFLMLRNQGDKVNPSRVKFFEIEDIQLGLIKKKIELSIHAQQQMEQRGYSSKDVISCIWTGTRTELQFHRGAFKAILEGLDSFGNPINVVVGCKKFTKQTRKNQFYIEKSEVYADFEEYISSNKLVIISVMPPIMDKFTRHVTHYEDSIRKEKVVS